MSAKEITLNQAPEHFFDPAKWIEFLARYSSREAALKRLSRTEPGFLAHYRTQAAETSVPAAQRAREEERLVAMRNRLLEGFKAMLTAGELVATGILPNTTVRKPIPAGLWEELGLDFERSTAKSDNFHFHAVSISKAALASGHQADFLQQCIEFLRGRQESKGPESRKKLEPMAKERFGDALTTRKFDEAFSAVYGYKRGRPRKGKRK